MSDNENIVYKNDNVEDKARMDENAKALRSMSSIEILIHGRTNPTGADLSCDYSMFEKDFDYGPQGKWVCKLQKNYYASDQYGIDSMEYLACNNSNHQKCPLYMKQIEIK